jgi:hypothetical protein
MHEWWLLGTLHITIFTLVANCRNLFYTYKNLYTKRKNKKNKFFSPPCSAQDNFGLEVRARPPPHARVPSLGPPMARVAWLSARIISPPVCASPTPSVSIIPPCLTLPAWPRLSAPSPPHEVTVAHNDAPATVLPSPIATVELGIT